jgi:hypothetical protein
VDAQNLATDIAGNEVLLFATKSIKLSHLCVICQHLMNFPAFFCQGSPSNSTLETCILKRLLIGDLFVYDQQLFQRLVIVQFF